MLGIFTGMFVFYYVKNKEHKNDDNVKEKEYDDDNTDKYACTYSNSYGIPLSTTDTTSTKSLC